MTDPCAGNTYKRDLDDGRTIAVYPMTFGKGRICIGPTGWPTYDDAYCYAELPRAVTAAEQWDGNGDPDGWIRHINSGRRRPYGNPAEEYVD